MNKLQKTIVLAAAVLVLFGLKQVFADTILSYNGTGTTRDTVVYSLDTSGNQVLTGNQTVGGNVVATGYVATNLYQSAPLYTFNNNITITGSPIASGVLGQDAAHVLYISTGTGAGAWVKVGSQ